MGSVGSMGSMGSMGSKEVCAAPIFPAFPSSAVKVTASSPVDFSDGPVDKFRMSPSAEQLDTTSRIADNERVVLPRLGGARPRLADAVAWCTSACLAVVCYRQCCTQWRIGSSTTCALAAGPLFAMLLSPVWALWRFDKFSERLANVSFRRELALAGVSVPTFLRHQLRGDAVAALGPMLTPILGTAAAVIFMLSDCWHRERWLYHNATITLYVCAVLAMTSSIAIALAGVCWSFSARCRGASAMGISARTALGLLGVYTSLFLSLNPHFYRVYGFLGFQLTITAVLFVAAAQLCFRASPEKEGAALDAKRLLYGLCVGAVAELAGCCLFFSLGPSNRLQLWGAAVPVSGVAGAYFFAAVAGMALRKRLLPWDTHSTWPAFAIGCLAIAAGFWAAHPGNYISSRRHLFPVEVPQALALTLPVAGMALLVACRPLQPLLRERLKLVAGQALFTMAGVYFGLWILTIREDVWSSGSKPMSWAVVQGLPVLVLVLAACAAGVVGLRRACERNNDTSPSVFFLGLGAVFLLITDMDYWVANGIIRSQRLTSPAVFAIMICTIAIYVFWIRIQRDYFDCL